MTVAACSYSAAAIWHDYKDLDRTIVNGAASAVARSLEKHRKHLCAPLKNVQRVRLLHFKNLKNSRSLFF